MKGQSPVVLSILTPTLNAASTVRETVESVLSQKTSLRWEHVIRDGGSTDGTTEILAEYPHLLVQSRKDAGLYDAMNRAAADARGNYLLFLQGDDLLAEGALEAIRMTIESAPEAAVLSGGALAFRPDGTIQWKTIPGDFCRLRPELLILWEPMLNARVYKKDLFFKIGPFDPAFPLAADRDFLLRLAASAPTEVLVPKIVCEYRWHKGSRTMSDGNNLSLQLNAENLAICEKFLRKHSGIPSAPLRIWHKSLTVQNAMIALEEFSLPRFFRVAWRGTRKNPLWPFALLAELFRCLPGFVRRGFRTRSSEWKQSA